ncbi:unnamed protein product [Miscanthus lutarioriparius]|uniref:Uncharacterized protein n=1 Tax=Miscanthus lutarioriparius TaxID=422564 RepID=A0A811QNV5_9POAL|nr:unnamed protein product [Miscanthus lutarioriparius]
MTTRAWERLDTGKERKRRGFEKVEEGLEVLTAKPIEPQRLDAGDQRWWSSPRKNRDGAHPSRERSGNVAQARTALQAQRGARARRWGRLLPRGGAARPQQWKGRAAQRTYARSREEEKETRQSRVRVRKREENDGMARATAGWRDRGAVVDSAARAAVAGARRGHRCCGRPGRKRRGATRGQGARARRKKKGRVGAAESRGSARAPREGRGEGAAWPGRPVGRRAVRDVDLMTGEP